MSIIGIGIDILEIKRIDYIVNRFKLRFVHRILSKKEWKKYLIDKNKINFLAKIFTVKEAIVKALGIGFQKGISFHDFELSHNDLGKPYVILINKSKKIANKKGVKFVHISISDTKLHTTAIAIVEN